MAGEKILIVDDDTGILNMLGLLFQFEGYQSITCDHAPDAMQRIQSDRPALVLLDAMMPQMDGLEMLKLLNQQPTAYRPPIVLLTGTSDPGYKKTALEFGACDIISKPFIKEELLARVRRLLEPSA
jgi:DNA-binding response OmpR family regulator